MEETALIRVVYVYTDVYIYTSCTRRNRISRLARGESVLPRPKNGYYYCFRRCRLVCLANTDV